MANLVEGIAEEIERCTKLVQFYDELGAVGQFGKTMIQQSIDNAKAALSSGDVVVMVHAYMDLKGCE